MLEVLQNAVLDFEEAENIGEQWGICESLVFFLYGRHAEPLFRYVFFFLFADLLVSLKPARKRATELMNSPSQFVRSRRQESYSGCL